MREIRIRQLSYEDARLQLENQLNEAFMAGETRVAVLHGIGTGALKKLTEEVARECGFAKIVTEVVNYNPGVTLVDLQPPGKSELRRYRA